MKKEFIHSVSVTRSIQPLWNMNATALTDLLVLFSRQTSPTNYQLQYGFPNMDFTDLWYNQQTLTTDSLFYGMSNKGGHNLQGYLFQYNPINSTFTMNIHFEGKIAEQV